MDTHEARLRSARRPGTWTLRWDDQAYHLFDPTGRAAYPSFSTLGFATVLDRYDLLIRHRIAFRMWDDRFESDGDPVAARAFARVLYPLLVRDEDDEQGAAALAVVRRWRAGTTAVVAVAAVAPVPVASAAVRSRVGPVGVVAMVGRRRYPKASGNPSARSRSGPTGPRLPVNLDFGRGRPLHSPSDN